MKRVPAFFLIALSVAAQDWQYSKLTTDGDQPPPRIDGTITYSADSASLYVFGGQADGTLNDLWAYSFSSNKWRRLVAEGTAPLARLGHTLVTDSKRNRLILFGGQARGFFSDVWAYDIKGNRWNQLAADNAGPSQRYGHSAVLDAATDRMIVSHGFTSSGRFDDTWAFDLASNQWRNLTPSGTKPLRRCLHHAVIDPAARQMLLYGGCASGSGPCPLGDLWSFHLDSNTWSELTPSSKPAPRQHYGFSYDSRRNRAVLFGGSGSGTLGDTWFFNPTTRIWNQLPTSVQAPAARMRHQGAYASERGATYFFGGSTNTGASNELWALSSGLAHVPRLFEGGAVNAFSGMSGGIAPGEYISVFGDSLGPDSTISLNGANLTTLFSSAGQINLRVPSDLTAAEAIVRVSRENELSNELRVPVVASHPGLWMQGVNQDGTLNSASSPAEPQSIVTFYATGQGSNAGLPIALDIGGIPVELLYADTPSGAAGLLQINARVPLGFSGAQTTRLRIGEATSQDVKLYIR